MENVEGRLKEKALELGFDLVGIAAAGPADPESHLAAWLAAGRHGTMEYMARTATIRTDPRAILPGCRSVIVVAMSYHTSKPLSREALAAAPDRVWVSRYAWGRDYHRVIKKALIGLGRWIESVSPGAGWRACVDTAPVLERAWAVRAGLGWSGKNTCLLNRRMGSELFLGVLLTTLPLSPDAPSTAHCGRCTACLDACPTGALVQPGVLEARRCIAYLTVEHRGPIPPSLHASIDRMVAGCDICQEVCPWNRRAPTDLHPDFQPAPHRYLPKLEDLESLDEEAWAAWRQASPLGRISHADLKRNLAVAELNRTVG
jgi:epoxyqueuosine reductase